jgi:hypothetical protein
VIETRSLPALLIVTGRAVLAQAAPVGVLGPVAVDAGGGGFAMLRPGLVAAGAGDGAMGAVKRVVGREVVEDRLVQPDDVGLSPLVVGMAASAGGGREPLRLAVEARCSTQVLAHLLVALDAERILG